ncbi:MAG: hypothetical protein KDK10_15810 [Maritimibacter sp.]|nr:hypothetical protein [Maritimibacter sp.]
MTHDNDDLARAVARMEARLAAGAGDALRPAYAEVAARFDADLADRRDRLFNRGATLMLAEALRARSGQ